MILYRKRGIGLYSSSGVGMTFSKGGRFKWDFIFLNGFIALISSLTLYIGHV